MELNKEKYLTEGECISSAGVKLNSYYDFLKALTDKYFLGYAERKIKEFVRCNLVGIETFGTLLLIYIVERCPTFYINPIYLYKKRTHGAKKQLYYSEYRVELPTYLLDDVITTGSTIKYALDVLKRENIIPTKVLCFKNRSPYPSVEGLEIIEL